MFLTLPAQLQPGFLEQRATKEKPQSNQADYVRVIQITRLVQ